MAGSSNLRPWWRRAARPHSVSSAVVSSRPMHHKRTTSSAPTPSRSLVTPCLRSTGALPPNSRSSKRWRQSCRPIRRRACAPAPARARSRSSRMRRSARAASRSEPRNSSGGPSKRRPMRRPRPPRQAPGPTTPTATAQTRRVRGGTTRTANGTTATCSTTTGRYPRTKAPTRPTRIRSAHPRCIGRGSRAAASLSRSSIRASGTRRTAASTTG